MAKLVDMLVSTLKGLGKVEAKKLGQELRGNVNDRVAGTDPTWDNDVVEIFDSFVEGLGDDTATNAEPGEPGVQPT